MEVKMLNLLILLSSLVVCSCTVGGTGAANTTGEGTSSSISISGAVVGTVVPDSGADGKVVANAQIKVESHPEVTASTDSEGHYSINNIDPGEYTLYISSAILAGLSVDEKSGSSYGVKIENVVVTAKSNTTIPDQTMKKTGSLTGIIEYFQNPNNLDKTGTDVYVPGTDFIAKTSSTGAFTLSNLPEGTYNIRMDHLGFQSFTLKDVTVTSGQVTDVGTKLLDLTKGPQGSIAIDTTSNNYISAQTSGADHAIFKNKIVPLKITYNADAVWMKISDESAFLNKQLELVSQTKNWTFTTDGLKRVYIQFYDLNALPSSVYYVEFFVDTEVPTISKLTILNGWAQTAKQTIFINSTTQDTGSGVKEIMLSNTSSNFNNGETWQTYTNPINWSLTANVGSKTVYVKVRDYVGNESVYSSDSINLGDYTLVYITTYNEKIIFYKEQSPYLISGQTTFNGEVEFKPGSVVYTEEYSGKMIFNEKVTAIGTTNDHISIGQSTNGGTCDPTMPPTGILFDNSNGAPGVSQNSVFQYVDFITYNQLIFNGGTITNNSFATVCTDATRFGGTITKKGLDNFNLSNNTFNHWLTLISVENGSSNTVVQNNSGTIYNFFSQASPATGTVLTNNSFSSATGTIYNITGGSFSKNGNSFAGTCKTFINYGTSTDMTISEGSVSTCTTAISKSGNSTLTVNSLSLSGCDTAIDLSGGTMVINNSSFTSCKKGILTNSATSSVTSNSTVFSVTEKLISANSSLTASFNNGSITCSNNAKYCDFLFSLDPSGRTFNLNFSGNQMRCLGDNTPGNNNFGCRGFAFQQTYTGNVTVSLTLNFNSNTWITTGGKILNSNLAANMVQDFNSIVNSQSTPPDRAEGDVRIFKFIADGATSISFSPLSITTTSEATAP
jgi:hypothetical protein